MRIPGAHRVALATVFAAALPAAASSLQVAPTGLDFTAESPAQALWLANTGKEPITAQVRVFAWTQADGEDVLDPTNDLMASPPMLRIAPGARQLIRIVRGGGEKEREQAFRIVIDELPAESGRASGIQYVLRYSVPAFVAGSNTTAPALDWTTPDLTTGQDGNLARLEASNRGGTHARITSISLVGRDGKETELRPGLLGYVLPGARMHWKLAIPAGLEPTTARMKVQVNGIATELPQAISPPSR